MKIRLFFIYQVFNNFSSGETVTFVLPCASDPENKMIVSNQRKVLKCDLKSNEAEILGEVEKDITDIATRFNDGKCDSKGRLWAGMMNTRMLFFPYFSVFRLTFPNS